MCVCVFVCSFIPAYIFTLYYTGGWISELPKFNVTPLINSRVCLLAGRRYRDRDIETGCFGGLYLAGMEDVETRLKMSVVCKYIHNMCWCAMLHSLSSRAQLYKELV